MLLFVLCSLAQAMPNNGPPKHDDKAGTARWIANNNIVSFSFNDLKIYWKLVGIVCDYFNYG